MHALSHTLLCMQVPAITYPLFVWNYALSHHTVHASCKIMAHIKLHPTCNSIVREYSGTSEVSAVSSSTHLGATQ